MRYLNKIGVIVLFLFIFTCSNPTIKTEDNKSVNQEKQNPISYKEASNNVIDALFYNNTVFLADYINKNNQSLAEGSYNTNGINYSITEDNTNKTKSIVINDIIYNQFIKDDTTNNNLLSINRSTIGREGFGKLPLGIHLSKALATHYLSTIPAFLSSFTKSADSNNISFVIDDYRDIATDDDYKKYDVIILVCDDNNNVISKVFPSFTNLTDSNVVTRFVESYNTVNEGTIGLVRKKQLHFKTSLNGIPQGATKLRIVGSFNTDDYFVQVIVPPYIKGVMDDGRFVKITDYGFTLTSTTTTTIGTTQQSNILGFNNNIIEDIIIKEKSINNKNLSITVGENDDYYLSKMSPVVTSYKIDNANPPSILYANNTYTISWDAICYKEQKMGVALTIKNNLDINKLNNIAHQDTIALFVQGQMIATSDKPLYTMNLTTTQLNAYKYTYTAVITTPSIDLALFDTSVNLRFFVRNTDEPWRGAILSSNIANTDNAYQIKFNYSNGSSEMVFHIPLPAYFWNWNISQPPGGTYSHLDTIYNPENQHPNPSRGFKVYDYWSFDFSGGIDTSETPYKEGRNRWYEKAENVTQIPILSACDGIVKTVEYNGGYGNHIIIEHSGGYRTLYGHLVSINPLPSGVSLNNQCTRGIEIGKMGKTGNVTGVHLHWSIVFNGYSAYDNTNKLVHYYDDFRENVGSASAKIEHSGITERINAIRDRMLPNYIKNWQSDENNLQSNNGTFTALSISGFTAETATTGVKLSWDALAGATTYEIERTTVGGDYFTKTVSSNTWTDYTIGMNRTYNYRVRGVTNYKFTDFTNTVSYQRTVAPIKLSIGSNDCTIAKEDIKKYYFDATLNYIYKITITEINANIKTSIYRTSTDAYTDPINSSNLTNMEGEPTLTKTIVALDSQVNLWIETIPTSGGSGNFTINIEKSTIPYPPTNLSATNGSFSDKINLTWDRSVGAINYEIYRSLSQTGTYNLIGTSSDNSFTDYICGKNRTYYYKVKAYNSNGYSDYSNIDNGLKQYTLLGLSTTATSYTLEKEDILWFTFNVTKNIKYKILWTESSDPKVGNIKVSGYKNDKTTSYFINDSDSPYDYFTASTTESIFIKVEGTDLTQTGSFTICYDGYKPSAPTGLYEGDSTLYTGYSSCELKWNTVSDATSYKVYRTNDISVSGSYSHIITVLSNFYTDTGLLGAENSSGGIIYYYVVTASNEFGESNYSNEIAHNVKTRSIIIKE
ncbi:MAG: hypothetical protein A2086_07010 [Spirochaetes bacterium GWD1_27_9]|nr:MAG: hypothetical protein A2Z98_15640 [Spirochaetes bacterium GWB1_27_13]OHD26397.1 MAG: hypothetical protein A2Y34_14865 [Spirochaetes bacterium GWC1_27_15]OHD44446.1 MAG: hypothetical protein A2086_07010 [Spirochaetes bacterium GWD1_27_9]